MKIKIKSIFIFFLSLIFFFCSYRICYAAEPKVPKSFYVAVGGILTIPTDLSSCQGKTKKWSSNSDVISITSNGSVKGLKLGSGTAYCTTSASEIGITNVIVVPAAKLSINRQNVTISKNSSIKLSCTVTPNNAIKSVNWNSSDPAIATVDANGNVKSKSKNGVCIITCTSADGTNNSVTCKVTVYSEETTTVKPNSTTQKDVVPTKKPDKPSTTVKQTQTSEQITKRDNKENTTGKEKSEHEPKFETNTENTTEVIEEKVVKKVLITDDEQDNFEDIEFEVAAESDYQLIAVSKKNNPIKIQWNEIDNVDGYELYCADKSMKFNTIYCGTNNFYDKHHFQKGTDYFFSVRGYRYINNKKVYIDSSEIIHIQAVNRSLFKL